MRHPSLEKFLSLHVVPVLLVSACTVPIDEGPSRPTGDAHDASAVPQGMDSPVASADGSTGKLQPSEGQHASCTGQGDVGESPLRRLSNLEYQLTLQDLLQLAEPPVLEDVPADNRAEGFLTQVTAQAFSAQHLRAYAEQADKLAATLLADVPRRSKVLGCELTKADCLTQFVARFGELAYRRTLTKDEIAALAARAVESSKDVSGQVRFALQLLLTSPHFLYRLELGDKPDGLASLTPEELASRLSFLLWGRGPTAELMSEARRGALDTAEGRSKVAEKMLADPRAAQYATAFFRQWLGYDLLREPEVKPKDWSPALLAAMQRETDAVLGGLAFGKGSFLDALVTDSTHVTPELATFYGLPKPATTGTMVIPPEHPRAATGILSHASLMSAKGDGDLISVRGNWLRSAFFCSSLHIPAAVTEQLGELSGLGPVEIVHKRNTEAACKGCHSLIDPIGVGLLGFDKLGRWDATVDASVYGLEPAVFDLDEPRFESVRELAQKLHDSPEVARCVVEKLFVYSQGREPSESDQCLLDSADESFANSGHSLRELYLGLVRAPEFRLRRAPAPASLPPKEGV